MTRESYYNTTRSAGRDLGDYERTAQGQELAVAEFYRQRRTPASPSEVHRALATRAPLTSIRRAITNLTRRGVLEKLDDQVPGPYSRPEYLWRYAREPQQRGLF